MDEYTNYPVLKERGDFGEQYFAKYLERRNHTNIDHIDDIYKEEGLNLRDWDIRSTDPNGVTKTFEVKTQEDCDKWGTINIEQVQSGEAAGIATSKADLWIFVNQKLGIGVIEAEKLKKIHRSLIKDPTINKESYVNRERRNGVQLWITKYRNFAAGWKMNLNDLKWINDLNINKYFKSINK